MVAGSVGLLRGELWKAAFWTLQTNSKQIAILPQAVNQIEERAANSMLSANASHNSWITMHKIEGLAKGNIISDSKLMRGYSQVALEKGEKSELQSNKEEIISLNKDRQMQSSVFEVGNCLHIKLQMKMHVHASTVDGVRFLTLKGTHTVICDAILKLIFMDDGVVLTSKYKAVGYKFSRYVVFREIGTEYFKCIGQFGIWTKFHAYGSDESFQFLRSRGTKVYYDHIFY
ncbi:hypothetical protein MKW98_024999 [Papaver atlanticum]|uniref:Uncharacterized protein n=1 Tax=Papaver atlanticum TaxID=357466 RepID=A0AAD4T229_9MAGN|nr:hypothetical protein MKW98_024999 [Papaver atlanticum]